MIVWLVSGWVVGLPLFYFSAWLVLICLFVLCVLVGLMCLVDELVLFFDIDDCLFVRLCVSLLVCFFASLFVSNKQLHTDVCIGTYIITFLHTSNKSKHTNKQTNTYTQ